MTDAGLISERLRKKSLEKKAAEQHKREEMLREYNRRLRENEKSPFFLSEVQKKEVREYWESHTNFRKSQNPESDTQLNVEGWVEYYSGLYGMYDRRFLPDPVEVKAPKKPWQFVFAKAPGKAKVKMEVLEPGEICEIGYRNAILYGHSGVELLFVTKQLVY